MRTTPELAPPLQILEPHRREDVWLPTYHLPYKKPNTRRISSGIGFRTWNPPAPRRGLTRTPSRSQLMFRNSVDIHLGLISSWHCVETFLFKLFCAFVLLNQNV
ncbi:hypothetical protein AVEN_222987-1 [Araneus ventricosus]|nr:hypothetical protein AVEN_222987-1 [Araneus ventricosus]